MFKTLRVFLLLSVSLIVTCSCARLQHSVFAEVKKTPEIDSARALEAFETLTQSNWLGGNSIETLENGDAYFPAMLKAVKQAKQSITFESFIVVASRPTAELFSEFMRKSQQGVKVHVILDYIGSAFLDEKYVEALRQSGVEFSFYNPLKIGSILSYNNRGHRKVLVVDGKIAFTGGAGYARSWRGKAQNKDCWRDTQYKIEGPIVANLQKVFANNWKEVSGVRMQGERYYPQLEKKVKDIRMLVNLGAPKECASTIGEAYLLAIDLAKQSILIESAYFVPNKAIRAALIRAKKRGVRVQIITPNDHIDTPFVRYVSRALWGSLLKNGIEIYEFQPSMMHAKLMVVDDTLSIVGSANMDDRSYFINDEVNVCVLDKSFVKEQKRMFYRDLARSTLQTIEEVRGSSWEAPLQWGSRLLAPQL